MSFIKFIIFSMLEGTALYAITLSLFRYKIKDYIWKLTMLNFFLCMLSYFMREDLNLSNYVPILNVICIALFVFIFIEIPIISSFIVSLSGFVALGIVQTIIVMITTLSGATLEQIQGNTMVSYIVQVITAGSLLTISYLMYKKGIGFSAPFTELTLYGEKKIYLLLIFSILISLSLVLVNKNLYYAEIFFLLAMAALLYFQIRKERASHK